MVKFLFGLKFIPLQLIANWSFFKSSVSSKSNYYNAYYFCLKSLFMNIGNEEDKQSYDKMEFSVN